LLKEHKNKSHSVVVPTPHNPDQDFFYYVNKQDEDEAFESLGYNPRCIASNSLSFTCVGTDQEDDFRVNKFW